MEFLKKDIKKIHKYVDFSEMKNKSILITGGTGLVGLYFLLSLKSIIKEYNIKVTIVHKSSNIEEYFKDFVEFESIKCLSIDITDSNAVNSELESYDYIIHAAGYGQPTKFLENKIKTLELNTISTLLLLQKLKRDGKFLFISSSEVYSGLNKNQTEDTIGKTTPKHHRACYIEGKRCGETMCNIYHENGFNTKSVRLSLTYGPGTKINDSRMLTNFIQKSIFNKKIDMLDSGDTKRTYLYIADAVIMCWNILFYGKENTYNVGGNKVLSVYDLAKKIGTIMNVDVVRPENDEKKLLGSPKFVKVSLKKYKEEFKMFPLESLDKGLVKTIEWQKFIYKNA